MKKTLLTLSLLGGMLLGYSQSVIWMDDFNDEDLSDWTLIDADMDGNNWGDMFTVNDSDQQPVTPVSLISRSWQGDPLTPDNWAISPAIDLSAVSGDISLEYITQVPAASWDEEHYTVYVSTTNTIDGFTSSATQMSETLGDAGNTGTPTPKSLDISAFAGEETVYIAFRHHDVTDMDFISIDDVTVMAESLSTSDLSSEAKSSLTLYPNPAKDLVKVGLGENFDLNKVRITVTNLTGKVVSKVSFDANGINVSNLPAGLYVVTATDGENTVSKKLIKK